MHTYLCSFCGKEFVSRKLKRGAKIFCSNECYHASTRKIPDAVCEQCGITFSPGTGSSRWNRRWCGWDCYSKSRAAELVEKICPVCAKLFKVSKSIEHRYTVCSRDCRTAATKYVTCERCGKIFRAEKRLNRHFCSEECRRPPVLIHCDICGKEFRSPPSQSSTRRFCSFRCYRLSIGETSIETKTKESLSRLDIAFEWEKPIGRYLIDFALTDLRVALEVDGHYWHRGLRDEGKRDAFLVKYGWRVIRITEDEINGSDLDKLILVRLNDIVGS
ncbi:MAG: endonuclease domain-containing protein [Bacillota bacterium]